MKTFLKKMAIFIFSILLILVIINIFMDFESHPHYPLQYQEVFYPRVDADVVILGASHATHGINPKYLETDHLKVYNFALNGAPPAFYLKWYRKIFRYYYRKPLCLIYAVHWAMFDTTFLRREFEQDSKYFPSSFFIKELKGLQNLQTLLFNRFPFSKNRKKIVNILFRDKGREVYPKRQYYNGFIPFKIRRNLNKTEVVHPKVDKTQFIAFEELLDDFERDQIRVIFVQVPGYLQGRDIENILDNVQLLKEIAERRKIPFLNYETERISSFNSNGDFFADWTHLNEKGSEAFTKILNSDLKAFFK